MNQIIETELTYGAKHYAPLPIVLTKGEGVFVWDDNNKKYLDMMSAYSAVSHGHCHPKLIKVLTHQSSKLNIVSRAYYTDQLAPFLQYICELFNFDKALPMNTGAEAVETALKAARKWAYTVKGVEKNKAEIITCEGNFHGRTISIVGFSTEEQYKQHFGPYPDGFKNIAYGDIAQLEQAINPNTAAFLIEPIQGEGGIQMPPEGYLKKVSEICKANNILLICDEIQTGLGRTGKLLASYHDDIQPDGLILGKALGGGVYPVSCFLANNSVMDVFQAGDHGSTFGGNPLAAAVALEALKLLQQENLIQNSAELGDYFKSGCEKLLGDVVTEVRGRGLFIGLEINPKITTAREICLNLMDKGLLSKDTHHTVVRLAPPLVITKQQIDQALEILSETIGEFSHKPNV